ncbi:MAG: ClpXP protease specificity-enhancing factor SspB, partial [Stellaceae bacterium]
VTLSFNNRPERIVIPFVAIAAFADPSVKFGLQFPASGEAAAELAEASAEPISARLEPAKALKPVAEATAEHRPAPALAKRASAKPAGKPGPTKPGEVVALDAFRKK